MSQYLDTGTHYSRQLIQLGNAGFPYVVACDEENQEPCYVGFKNLTIACAAAEKIQDHTGFHHIVFELTTDADGDWMTNYEDIR